MNETIANMISVLPTDNWRILNDFSPDFKQVQDRILSSGREDEIALILKEWLEGRNQPCLFGSIAAKRDQISFCILTQNDLKGSDKHIHDKIQIDRTKWTREAFDGHKSGFVILAVSPKIVHAPPCPTLLEIAKKLCSYYLELDAVEHDKIYLDEIWLQRPNANDRIVWRWDAGVNYFSAQGDKRWWQDHRIPGGMAFSVNSVGH